VLPDVAVAEICVDRRFRLERDVEVGEVLVEVVGVQKYRHMPRFAQIRTVGE
jgi:hypothetical protein